MTTYESALERISGLIPAESEEERLVEWLDASAQVGVARTNAGRVELFFVGPELAVTYRSIADQIAHQRYYRRDGGPFTASRLELPLAGHFDQVAAFICAEMIRNGAETDIEVAFAASEPVIDLALESLQSTDSWLRGLVAELVLLGALVARADSSAIPEVLNAWSGYQPSLRDFRMRGVGVEVKATSRGASTHSINGLYQVERQDDEDQLLLTSFVGLAWRPGSGHGAHTARRIIEGIAARVTETGHPPSLTEQLWFRVEEYLPKTGGAVDPLLRPFAWSAVRTYDLADPALQFLRSDDVANRPNTVLASVRYDIELPARVTGDLNPVVGLNKSAARILATAGIRTT